MKKTFYNPHTVIQDITKLDKKWLDKQNREKPYDQHYAYLEALRLIGKGEKKKFIIKVGELLFNTQGKVRVSSLLDRAVPLAERASNSISTVEIKSRKSEEMLKLSPLLMGLVPLASKISNESEENTELTSSNTISDTIQSPKSLTLDVIDLSELEEEKEATTDIKEGILLNQQADIQNDISIPTQDIEEDEEEEEEYVSNTVVLKEEPLDFNQKTEVVAPEETKKEVKVQDENPHHLVSGEEEIIPSVSESVQIEHSQFTSWLKGLPRLNEVNQLPETDPKSQIISEPYAKILVEQGHKTDAIRMYKQLMLKYPEKSSFFADQIKKLK